MNRMNIEKIRSFNTVIKFLIIPLLLGIFVFFTVSNIITYFMSNAKRDSNPLSRQINTSVSGSNSQISSKDGNNTVSSVLDETTVNDLHKADNHLCKALDKISSSYGATAVQVAVIKNGMVGAIYNYGYADKTNKKPVITETAFRVASLSKLIDTMAVMKLSEEEKIDVDSDIGTFLGYQVRSGKYPSIPITPRMLMTHTSSIVDSQSFLKSRNSSSSVSLKKLLSQSSSYSGNRPGRSHHYSNFGIAVLAAAAEKEAGQPFYEYTEQVLFKPLDIKGSFLASRLENPDNIACLYNTRGQASYTVKRQLNEKCKNESGQTHHIYQGNLTISAVDYAKLLCVLLNKGKGENGKKILLSESVSEILKVQYESGNTCSCLCNFISDGIVKGRTMHYHTGSNFGMYSSFAFDTNDLSGVVVLTSGANAKKESSGVYNICGDIIRKIYSSYYKV